MNVLWLWISQKSFSFVCRTHIYIYISQSQLSFNFFSGFPARLIVISIYYNIIKFLTNSAVIFFLPYSIRKGYKLQDYVLFATYFIDM